MTRRLLNLLTLLSLLLCVATVLLWVRSREHMTSWVVRVTDAPRGGENATGFCCVHGGVYWMTGHRKPTEGRRPARTGVFQLDVGPRTTGHFFAEPDRSVAGFELNRAKARWESSDDPAYVRVPLWAVTFATLILPALRIIGWRRRTAARARASCACCGYDLRDTPDRCRGMEPATRRSS